MGNISESDVPDSPQDFIDINKDLAKDPSREYEGMSISHLTMYITDKQLIDNSYTVDEAKDLLDCFLNDFPYDEGVIVQASLWMRFFSGFHLFEDANHRTGMDSLLLALSEAGVDRSSLYGKNIAYKTKKVRNNSKEKRKPDKYKKNNSIFKKDELYKVWHNYFEGGLD